MLQERARQLESTVGSLNSTVTHQRQALDAAELQLTELKHGLLAAADHLRQAEATVKRERREVEQAHDQLTAAIQLKQTIANQQHNREAADSQLQQIINRLTDETSHNQALTEQLKQTIVEQRQAVEQQRQLPKEAEKPAGPADYLAALQAVEGIQQQPVRAEVWSGLANRLRRAGNVAVPLHSPLLDLVVRTYLGDQLQMVSLTVRKTVTDSEIGKEADGVGDAFNGNILASRVRQADARVRRA